MAELSDLIKESFEKTPKETRGELVRANAILIGAIHSKSRQEVSQLFDDLATAQYDLIENTPPEQKQNQGYLDALVDSAEGFKSRLEDPEITTKVQVIEYGPQILKIIKDKGTISHGDLSEISEVDSEQITDQLKQLNPLGLITATMHGKFKYYSLTPQGHTAVEYL